MQKSIATYLFLYQFNKNDIQIYLFIYLFICGLLNKLSTFQTIYRVEQRKHVFQMASTRQGWG